MRRFSILLAVLIIGAALPAAAAARPFPERIDLPNGFAPEGIAVGSGPVAYAGSLSGMGIWRADLRTGEGSPLVESGGPFTGMKVDALNRLWVAGGPTGTGRIFDATTGEQIGEPFTFATGDTFINDVVIAPDAAYFTDSRQPALYRVPLGPGAAIGEFERIPLNPDDIGFDGTPGAFNLNGIEAVGGGRMLISVNSMTGALIAIDPASGDASTIELGDDSVVNGDGILLRGLTLYVVQNADNQVAVVRLAPDLSSGRLVSTIQPDGVDVPTTAAPFGDAIYVVNARFGVTPGPAEAYWITRIGG
jgi:hypothetical protein